MLILLISKINNVYLHDIKLCSVQHAFYSLIPTHISVGLHASSRAVWLNLTLFCKQPFPAFFPAWVEKGYIVQSSRSEL